MRSKKEGADRKEKMNGEERQAEQRKKDGQETTGGRRWSREQGRVKKMRGEKRIRKEHATHISSQ